MDEDDTPAFVDLQSLRNLAAGKNNWKYATRKERKAAKAQGEVKKLTQRAEDEMA